MISYMKKNGLILLGIVPLLLASCAKNKNAILMINNGDLLCEDGSLFIDTDEERIVGMMKSNLSFILYEYSTGCSHCNDSSKNFEQYFKKYQYTIYRYNTYMGDNYQLLNNYDSKAFPLEYGVPRVIIVSHGRYVDEVASSKLVKSNLFNSGINAFTRENKYLYSTTTIDGFNKLKEKDKEFNLLIYDSLHQVNIDKYHLVYDNKDFDEYTILVDEAFASSQLLEYLAANY